MILETCTEEQGRILLELGLDPNLALFYHTSLGVLHIRSIDFSGKPAPALTSGELGVLLPHTITCGMFKYQLWTIKEDNQWNVTYVRDNNIHIIVYAAAAPTEAIARAAMLIFLIKHKFYKFEPPYGGVAGT